MQLVPSLSIINGKVVRLTQGDFSKEKVYGDTPVDVAKQFEDHGIEDIHLVDLDGAKKGSIVNYHLINVLATYTKLKVNFAGGLHTDGDVLKAFEYHADSVMAASVAVLRPDLFSNWLMSYGREKIALVADCIGDKVYIRGWQKETSVNLFDHIEHFYQKGLKFLKVTDISKDGALAGPSFSLYEKLLKLFPDLNIFASGGVRNMEDICRLKDIGVYGAIFGKAFYEGRISLKDIDAFQAGTETS